MERLFFDIADKFYSSGMKSEPVPGYTWNKMADELVPSMVSDLACSGAYSESSNEWLGGHFWRVIELIEKMTGRDLDKEASSQNI